MEYCRATERKHKYESPAEWLAPRDDHKDCYFCLFKNGQSSGTTMIKPVLKPKITDELIIKITREPNEMRKIKKKPNKMRTEKLDKPECVEYRNCFCYVCGHFVEDINRRYKINGGIEKYYLYCFSKDIQSGYHRPGKISFYSSNPV